MQIDLLIPLEPESQYFVAGKSIANQDLGSLNSAGRYGRRLDRYLVR
jgi:hypothetical protein